MAPPSPPPPGHAAPFPEGAGGGSRVTIVGAGPGDPGLLTLRGLERLRDAECVVHDALVPEALLDAAAPRAERIRAPRDAGDPDPGAATGRLLVELARRGRRVVRLKGGDPSVFARYAEETRALEEAGIPFETVPGVTALLAAAAAAGVPLTRRDGASHLTLVTGHEAGDKGAPLDYRQLASLPGTLAFYMGVAKAPHWAAELVAAGRPADTPVVVVSRCSWPDQRVVRTTLGALAAGTAAFPGPPPALVIVGQACGDRRPAGTPEPARRTAATPLSGRRVLLTRPDGQGGEIAAAVEALGGTCLRAPLVRITAPASWGPLDAAIRAADTFDWIVFASANGVRGFDDRLRAAGRDARALGSARLAAIGPATTRALADARLACDLEPDRSDSEGMLEALLPTMRRGRVLLVRAERGRDVMRVGLEAAGHQVTEAAAYAARPIDRLAPEVESALDDAPIDWVTVTSGVVAETAARVFAGRLGGWRIASISPVTSRVLEGLGFPPDCEAARPDGAALVAAMAVWEAARRGVAEIHGGRGSGAGPAP
ncbi:MAG: uroporphyrinogen-III C-methyltransferase [Planctomycetaceae bacterium]